MNKFEMTQKFNRHDIRGSNPSQDRSKRLSLLKVKDIGPNGYH